MKIQSVENYLNYKADLNRKSTEQYRKPLYDFCEWLSAKDNGKKITNQVLQSVTQKTCQEYVIELKKTMATNSVQKHRTIVKSYYNYLVMQGLVNSNPMSMTQIPYDMAEKSRVKDRIKVDEIQKLINCADDTQHKLQIGLMGIMGFRKTEVVNLKVSDINLNNMTVTFLRKGTGNKIQSLPILNDVKDLLVEHYNDAKSKGWTYMFESPVKKGQPITLMAVTKTFDKCKEKAGMSDRKVSCHSARGTAITNIASKKGLVVAKDFSNHVSIITTQKYISETNLVDSLRGL